MTTELFRDDADLNECDAVVTAVDGMAVQLDRTVFYPQGGGQAGDAGVLQLPDGRTLAVADTRKGADAELDANPQLVRSMSVQPPRGSGRVRLVEVQGVDLQPCGGTHVNNTADIGPVVVTKIEKKSATTRRVVLGFAPANPSGA